MPWLGFFQTLLDFPGGVKGMARLPPTKGHFFRVSWDPSEPR